MREWRASILVENYLFGGQAEQVFSPCTVLKSDAAVGSDSLSGLKTRVRIEPVPFVQTINEHA